MQTRLGAAYMYAPMQCCLEHSVPTRIYILDKSANHFLLHILQRNLHMNCPDNDLIQL